MGKIAVLTGDIINSTKLNEEQRKELEHVLWNVLGKMNLPEDKYEIIRGDSFQLLLDEPKNALMKSIQIRCLIKSEMADLSKTEVDARISIGIGEMTFMGKTLGSSDGSAFRRSGLGLDELKKKKKRFIILSGNEETDEIFGVISVLVDVIIKGWSAAQAEAVYLRTLGYTQQKIANTLSIVQSAVNKRLQSAHWNEIKDVLNFFEKYIREN